LLLQRLPGACITHQGFDTLDLQRRNGPLTGSQNPVFYSHSSTEWYPNFNLPHSVTKIAALIVLLGFQRGDPPSPADGSAGYPHFKLTDHDYWMKWNTQKNSMHIKSTNSIKHLYSCTALSGNWRHFSFSQWMRYNMYIYVKHPVMASILVSW
jgi:hypothetical protein